LNLENLKFKILFFSFVTFLTFDFYRLKFETNLLIFTNNFFKSYFFNENKLYLYCFFKIFSFVSGLFLYYDLIKLKQTEVCFFINMFLIFFISSYFV